MDFDNPKVYRDTSITDGLVLLFQGLGSSKYLSREDIMLDEEGHLLAVGGQHQIKEANTYGGSTIVGHLCPFPILKSIIKF